MPSATHGALLRAPAATFFLTAAVGRIGIVVTTLGIVWRAHARTSSFAATGPSIGSSCAVMGVVCD